MLITGSSESEQATANAPKQACLRRQLLLLTCCSPAPLRPLLQVFAPTDAAFAKFLRSMKLTSAQLLANPTLLKTVLSYHVVPEALTLAELGSGKNGQLDTLLDGETLFVSTPNRVLCM